jgi:hypothetical protein
MSLDGLRAWIGEVERKLGMRTRVFLALTVIAIGIGGAAVYLAIDTRESSVSESDVQALQQQLETRIDELAATPAAEPETESKPAPKPAPEAKPEGGKTDESGASNGATGSAPSGATGGDASAAKLQELVEQAKDRNEEAK